MTHHLVIIVLAFAACGSAATRPEPTPPPVAEGAEATLYRHPSSGMQFPVALETLERDIIKTYDARGDDVSVGYHRLDTGVTLAVTVYIYPKKNALLEEFATAKQAIETHRVGATLITEGPMQLEQRGQVHSGTRAHYLIRDPDGREAPQISHLFLFDHGPWRVKYRVTFFAHQHELADDVVMRFIRALPWPEVASGPIALYDDTK